MVKVAGKPEAKQPLRWLHLSDLHAGCPGQSVWWQVDEEFGESLRRELPKRGTPDLILFTGDLAYSGKLEEYDRVDQILSGIRAILRKHDPAADPIILAVPGNHDLSWPTGREKLNFKFLDSLDRAEDLASVRTEWFGPGSQPDHLAPLFANFLTWRQRTMEPTLRRPSIDSHLSAFPGDFSAAITLPLRPPLVVVGLNSAWRHYCSGDFERRLILLPDQLHSALGSGSAPSPINPLDRLQIAPSRLLLTHHPVSWLTRASQKDFRSALAPTARFSLTLHGHLHEPESEESRKSGGAPRHTFVAPSLFGLEHWGRDNEERLMGFAFGELRPDGSIHAWPLRRVQHGDGHFRFIPDPSFDSPEQGIALGTASTDRAPAPSEPEEPAQLSSYLFKVRQSHQRLEIRGIFSSSGASAHAISAPIEQLYTPLRSSGSFDAPSELRADSNLETAVSTHRLLLLEGQPGGGKTTFLKYLAFKAANRLAPEDESYPAPVRLAADDRVPFFLSLASLARRLSEKRAPSDPLTLRGDHEIWLLDSMVQQSQADRCALAEDTWSHLARRGKILFLCDGLDEVTDPAIRLRLVNILDHAARVWRDCAFVVTSRPIDTKLLEDRSFRRVVIDSFSDDDIRAYVRRWIVAIHAAEISSRVEEQTSLLEAALLDSMTLRRMASNPVMLTCLCVVHWNEHKLPEGRSSLYAAVVRWLVEARSDQRKAAGFHDDYAKQALRVLARVMMGEKVGRSKQVTLSRDEATRALLDMTRRAFRPVTGEPDRSESEYHAMAREWLEFEFTGSGVIQENSSGEIRFLHLTFQEFLAADYLARGYGIDSTVHEVVLAHLQDPQWRETIELFPACLHDRSDHPPVDDFVRKLIAHTAQGASPLNPANIPLPVAASLAGTLGAIRHNLAVFKYNFPESECRLYEACLARTLEIFDRTGAAKIPWRDRLEPARALGRAGDPRLRSPRNNLLPVSALPGALLGKYPVTVQEFLQFLDDSGYEKAEYWVEDGSASFLQDLKTKQPDRWPHQLEVPNAPVTGVSWFEAMAFCAWLTDRWKNWGKSITLPTSEIWDAATRANQRKYPWGNEPEPNEELANFDGIVRAVTPVGLYPAGAGPDGHLDLSGNVWEWSTSVNKSDNPLIRGGAWHNSAVDLRSAIRDWIRRSDRSDHLGFRVAAVPASR